MTIAKMVKWFQKRLDGDAEQYESKKKLKTKNMLQNLLHPIQIAQTRMQ